MPFGLEPITALAVGVGAVILAPVVTSIGSALGKDSNLNESLLESTREVTKKGIVWSFEVLESAQTIFSEAEESFRDLLADAKTEHLQKKDHTENSERTQAHEVEIVEEVNN
ncbi:MAG: DUF5132 domain-containing protein [Nostoc sp.]|uniref:DUF5132 domain-containing protein n=1 Tax=Nostoc sp. TaxID=1180 RepID=UPI002FFD2A04